LSGSSGCTTFAPLPSGAALASGSAGHRRERLFAATTALALALGDLDPAAFPDHAGAPGVAGVALALGLEVNLDHKGRVLLEADLAPGHDAVFVEGRGAVLGSLADARHGADADQLVRFTAGHEDEGAHAAAGAVALALPGDDEGGAGLGALGGGRRERDAAVLEDVAVQVGEELHRDLGRAPTTGQSEENEKARGAKRAVHGRTGPG
jgi:hypothetical protein